MGFSILYNLDRTYFWSSDTSNYHIIRLTSDSTGYIHKVPKDSSDSSSLDTDGGFGGSTSSTGIWSRATTGVSEGVSYTANYRIASSNSWYGGTSFTSSAITGSLALTSNCVLASRGTNQISVKLTGFGFFKYGAGSYPAIRIVCYNNSTGAQVGYATKNIYSDDGTDSWMQDGYSFTGLSAATKYRFAVYLDSPNYLIRSFSVTTLSTFAGATIFYNKSFAVMWSDSAVYAHSLARSTGTSVISQSSTSSSFQWSSNTSSGLVASGTYYARTGVLVDGSIAYSANQSFTANSSITTSSSMISTSVSGTSLTVKLTGCALKTISSSGSWPSIRVTLTYNGASTFYTMNYDTWNSTGYTFSGLTSGAEYSIAVVVDTPGVTIATGSVTIENTVSDVGFWIYTGSSTGWVKATPYIYNGSSWVQATPCIYSSGWITGS